MWTNFFLPGKYSRNMYKFLSVFESVHQDSRLLFNVVGWTRQPMHHWDVSPLFFWCMGVRGLGRVSEECIINAVCKLGMGCRWGWKQKCRSVRLRGYPSCMGWGKCAEGLQEVWAREGARWCKPGRMHEVQRRCCMDWGRHRQQAQVRGTWAAWTRKGVWGSFLPVLPYFPSLQIGKCLLLEVERTEG